MTKVRSTEYNQHRIATVFHEGGGRDVVIFCHGYRGDSIGPNRFFVKAANKLAENSISSLRFDQYGSGNSDGDFYNSSFNDWIETTMAIAKSYLEQGYRVCLFGQSMGGATAIAVASQLPSLSAVIAWAPDPNIEPFTPPKEGFIEEDGQRVQSRYWQEAHDAHVAQRLKEVRAPALIVQCTNDEYVNEENREALNMNAQPNHRVVTFDGYVHSGWTFEQAENIINESVNFLISILGTS